MILGGPGVRATCWSTVRQVSDDASLLAAIRAEAPPSSVVIGSSVSPDGNYGVAWTLLPTASYLMDDIFRRNDGGFWELWGGGSAGGINWTNVANDDDRFGVLRYGDEAPEGASVAVIEYQGETYRVPVRHGHFVLIVWDTKFSVSPQLVRFE